MREKNAGVTEHADCSTAKLERDSNADAPAQVVPVWWLADETVRLAAAEQTAAMVADIGQPGPVNSRESALRSDAVKTAANRPERAVESLPARRSELAVATTAQVPTRRTPVRTLVPNRPIPMSRRRKKPVFSSIVPDGFAQSDPSITVVSVVRVVSPGDNA